MTNSNSEYGLRNKKPPTNRNKMETISLIDALTKIAIPLLSSITWFLWGELKEQRKRVDDLQKEVVTQEQMQVLERRLQETFGSRVDDINRKLDLIISNVLVKHN